MLLHRLYYFRL